MPKGLDLIRSPMVENGTLGALNFVSGNKSVEIHLCGSRGFLSNEIQTAGPCSNK